MMRGIYQGCERYLHDAAWTAAPDPTENEEGMCLAFVALKLIARSGSAAVVRP